MAVLPAHLVATPVLERVGGERRGVVLGAGATAAWVDLDGFVVALTTREVPLLPNAAALTAGSGALVRLGVGPGDPARLAPGRIDLGPGRVTWDPDAPPTWDPTVRVPPDAGPESVARRGSALLAALGVDALGAARGVGAVDSRAPAPRRSATLPHRGTRQPGVGWPADLARDPAAAGPTAGLDPTDLVRNLVRELAGIGLPTAVDPDGAGGLALLFRAVRERDPEPAAAGARELLGRGPGLTPEGDDLVAAVAGALAVLGPTTGLDGVELADLLAALLGALAPGGGRTTALSATLLGLAAERRLAEPAGRLLDLGAGGEAGWPAALVRLERLGHGSGRAYAAGIGATAWLLAAGAPVR